MLGPEQAALEAIRAGVAFGVRNREDGWGAGLTVLTAMANVLPRLEPEDRPLALVHGLAFVSRDTRGRPPRFPLAPLEAAVPSVRLLSWYRRFIETRNGDAAERVLATATGQGASEGEMVGLMGAAATDHLFLDGGHTIDFTNKAFEVLDHLGMGTSRRGAAYSGPRDGRRRQGGGDGRMAPSRRHRRIAQGAAGAARRTATMAQGAEQVAGDGDTTKVVDTLAWAILGDDPGRHCRVARARAPRRVPAPRSWPGPWPTPLRYV